MRKITNGKAVIKFSEIRIFLYRSFPKQILRKSFRLISFSFDVKNSEIRI